MGVHKLPILTLLGRGLFEIRRVFIDGIGRGGRVSNGRERTALATSSVCVQRFETEVLVKSTLVITAGCLIAALTVGDTVYRMSPRPARQVLVAQGGVGDLSGLTDDEEQMNADLDGLFAGGKDGLDSDELASVRELAAIAKPYDSSWGEEFFKEGSASAGGISPYVSQSVTGAWDPTLNAFISSATSGPLSYYSNSVAGSGLVDEYALAMAGGATSSNMYGGGGGVGGAGGRRASAAVLASAISPTLSAIPEPTSLGLIGLAAGFFLRRKKSR